jgi:Cys-rich repeat protein
VQYDLGMFICVPFGVGCDCLSDRDCTDGKLCRPAGLAGAHLCVGCVDDADCPDGFMCMTPYDNICVPIAGSSSSDGSSSSGSTSA